MRYTEHQLTKLGEAARATIRALDHAISLAIPGASTLSIFRQVMTRALSNPTYRAAFPLLIAVNEELGHIAPRESNNIILQEGDIVSFDFGLAVDSKLLFSDYARTIQVRYPGEELSGHLVDYSEHLNFHQEYVNSALQRVPSLELSSFNNFLMSYFIEGRPRGVSLVSNLGGHEISPGVLHGTRGISIFPSHTTQEDSFRFPEGVFTIEPLLTFNRDLSLEAPQERPFLEGNPVGVYEFLVEALPEGFTGPEAPLLATLLEHYGHIRRGACFSEEQVLLRFPEYPREEVLQALSRGVLEEVLGDSSELLVDSALVCSHFEESFYVSHSPTGILVTNLVDL